MADPVTNAPKPGAKKGEFLGLPTWMWAVGGAVVVLGYLYIRSKQNQPAAGTGQGQGQAGWSSGSFQEWIVQHQSQPSHGHHTTHKHHDEPEDKESKAHEQKEQHGR